MSVNHVRSVQDLVTSIIIQSKHISKDADANVFQVIRISFAWKHFKTIREGTESRETPQLWEGPRLKIEG